MSPLHRASIDGNIKCLEALVREGADVNLQDLVSAS